MWLSFLDFLWQSVHVITVNIHFLEEKNEADQMLCTVTGSSTLSLEQQLVLTPNFPHKWLSFDKVPSLRLAFHFKFVPGPLAGQPLFGRDGEETLKDIW